MSEELKLDYVEIIRESDFETFSEIFYAAPRNSRTAIAKRLGVKKKSTLKGSFKDQRDAYHRKIYEAFMLEDDNELSEQLLRNWLLQKREMLASALDYMKIPHNNGLTDEELTAFEKLSAGAAKKLLEHLSQSFPEKDAYFYLRYVGVPKLKKPDF